MLDLTNKNVDELIHKHIHLLQDLHKINHPQMAYILEIAIPYIQEKHTPLKPEWKAWIIMTLKKLHESNKLDNDEDIKKHVDGFVTFANSDYEKHVNDTAMSVSDYDRDYPFMLKYLKTVGN